MSVCVRSRTPEWRASLPSPQIEISDYARKAGEAFAELIATVERLRSPGGCPWDADQTHTSLRQYLLEETYELLDAIDSGDDAGMEEELGDVMTQIAFHTDIAHRESRYDAASASKKIVEKLIRRHPHVFADADKLTDPDEVVDRWESLKREESGRTSIVASLPASLPALALAGSVQRRAIKAGLPWPEEPNKQPVFERVDGESDSDAEQRAASLLMQVSREIRQAGVDPEIALRTAAASLRSRVLKTEELAGGVALAELEAETRDRLWEQADNR